MFIEPLFALFKGNTLSTLVTRSGIAIYPFSILPFVIELTVAVAAEVPPVIVSVENTLLESPKEEYVIVLPVAVITLAVAPDVPPVILLQL